MHPPNARIRDNFSAESSAYLSYGVNVANYTLGGQTGNTTTIRRAAARETGIIGAQLQAPPP